MSASVKRSAVERNTGLRASFNTAKFLFLFLLAAFAASANVCTPLNYPATGPFPAIVNGIDQVDWGVARIQWTSDASSGVPATQQRIMFATAAQWASNPGTYPQTQGLQNITVSASNVIQGAILPNLQPSTTYHVIGQSYQGGAWCSAPDETFTTLAYSQPNATLPTQFDTTQPAVTGHDYTYGVDCGTTGTTTQKLQNCLNTANPGDGIGLPPGTYLTGRLYPNLYPGAVAISSISGSTITSPAHGMSNGQQIRFSGSYPPAPLQMGVTYQVINATTNTFQVSYDGINPLTLTYVSGGPTNYYIQWPLAAKYIVIHSTAPASALPPPGVRLDPVAYASSLPVIQATDPSGPLFNWSNFDSYYWFQNIQFGMDPTLAAEPGSNGVDPIGTVLYWNTGQDTSNIIWNQCAFIAPPPNRARQFEIDGTNVGFLNSYIQGLDAWQPFRTVGYATTTSTSVSIPSGAYYWVGAGGPVGTKKSCSTSGGSLNLSGSGSGSFVIYIDPTTCNLDAQVSNTVTAAGSGITVSSVASSPSYPTYSWTTPSGITINDYNVLKIGYGTVSNGSLSSYSDDPGQDFNLSPESGDGLSTGPGPGPIMVVNNFIQCAGVCGTFLTDGLTNGGSPCGSVTPCPNHYNQGNLTEVRNSIGTNPCYISNSSCWNGGNYYWRDVSEIKQGANVLKNGNIYGPYSAQVAQGGCPSQLQFQSGFPSQNGYPSYLSSGNLTFTNNTCYNVASGVGSVGLAYQAITPPLPQKNLIYRNNLFYNVNAYAQTSTFPPLGPTVAQPGVPGANCPFGQMFGTGGSGQGWVFDHNTVYGQAGCEPYFYQAFLTLGSGTQFTNNILNLVGWGSFNSAYTGMYYYSNSNSGGSQDVPNCQGFGGAALFNCLNNSVWKDNVVLATWVNSQPGSLLEYSNTQVSSIESLFPATTYFPNNGTGMTDRINQISWFNPSGMNMRLKSTSPYISGAQASSDGLDIGANIDQLEAAQGKVSNVHSYATTSTSTNVGFLAPDSFGCTVDWGTTNFASGTGTYTRVANAGGQRVQNVALTGLPANSLIYYRVNCAVQQPVATVQLP